MCGRFSEIKSQQELEYYYHAEFKAEFAGPSYNVGPGQNAPIVTANGIEMMRWGLVPAWAKSLNTGYSMINSRAETLFEKPTFKKPAIEGRCLIPATGYYEWKKAGDEKTPFYYTLKDRELFSFAGIYITRPDAEGKDFKTFSIITCEPNELCAQVHDRMPVILTHDEEKDWLNPDMIEPERIAEFLDAYPFEAMDAWVVDKRVGNIRNNDAKLVERVG